MDIISLEVGILIGLVIGVLGAAYRLRGEDGFTATLKKLGGGGPPPVGKK
jgi:hypothetical protein